MDNPFLQIKKNNFKLKIWIAVISVIFIIIFFVLSGTTNSALQNLEYYKKLNHIFETQESKEIDKLKKELQDKEKELSKYVQLKNTIKAHIMASGISARLAEIYASVIVKESNKRKVSPIIHTALLGSESSFKTNPRHDITNVIGMGGVYWDVWKDDLIKQKIAYNKEQLRNPITNIKASSYILGCYMKQTNGKPREALTHYKGYSKLGREQADHVMKIAKNIKKNTKGNYNV